MAEMEWPDKHLSRILLTDYQPTCENIMLDIRDRLTKAAPAGINLVNLRLYETPTSYAEWSK
jgi:6-pyruvoyltetrahydropterin/6-carboxytetrahydropterin synthase